MFLQLLAAWREVGFQESDSHVQRKNLVLCEKRIWYSFGEIMGIQP